jgi:hypothetical protein
VGGTRPRSGFMVRVDGLGFPLSFERLRILQGSDTQHLTVLPTAAPLRNAEIRFLAEIRGSLERGISWRMHRALPELWN